MKDKALRGEGGFSVFGFVGISGGGPSRRLLKSSPIKHVSAIADRFVYTSTRTYGVMCLCFGLLSLFLILGRYYIEQAASLAPSSWIVGLTFALLGIILVIFDKPVCVALQDFPLTDFLLFEFFAIRRTDKADGHHGIPVPAAILIGAIPAVVSFFVSPLYVTCAVGLLVFAALSLGTPELPFILTLAAAPYLTLFAHGAEMLAVLSVLSFVSFAFKVLLGKRVYSFCVYDALLLLLSVFIAVSGFVSAELRGTLIMIALTLGYIPASNIIMNRRLADCAVNALIVSSVPVTLLVFFDGVSAIFGGDAQSALPFFTSSASRGAYMLVAALLSLFFALEKKSRVKKAIYSTVFSLNVVGIVLLWHLGIWFAAAVTLIAAFVVRARSIRKELLGALLVLPYLLFLVPEGVFDWISERLWLSPTVSETFAAWEASFASFSEHIFFGTGFGSSAAGNTLLSFGRSFGLFAVVLLALIVLTCISHYSLFVPYMRNSLLSFTAASSLLSLFALFSFGMSADIFSDVTVYYLFIAVLGIFGAALRISKSDYDARLGYYGDQISADSSVVDVRITG